ncbi:hypothetical protein [Deinococcus sedimenti]|uniref:Uncharacterized protein n=1 Tax=Deinococcus sedimenti TaxID=1867090 RepID=A0ABQ2SBH7_9DEIO|nr:hypothetical protein [Deinococcus sedimenti]GGS07146.1 hypothetical protein GCM10008960_36980 [Deinococcus sedimenti]
MSEDLEVVVVEEIKGDLASVRLPDTSLDVWPLADLPEGVVLGDHVGVTVTDGARHTVLLPRPAGVRA